MYYGLKAQQGSWLLLCQSVYRSLECRSKMRLILYSKPGCHLCEGLQEKLEQIQGLDLELEVRDITTRDDWFQAFQYEVPVLFRVSPQRREREEPLPRPSPRATVRQLEQMLQKYLDGNDSE